MTRPDGYWQAHAHVLGFATAAGTYTLSFWAALIDELDRKVLDIDTAITLISKWRFGVQGISAPVSRATAYRLIESWRAVTEDLRNPGRGT